MKWRSLAVPLLLCVFALGLCGFQADRPFDRWHYFYDQRVFPLSRFPEGARLQAFQQWKRMEAAARTGANAIRATAGAALGPWKPIGPQPVVVFGNYVVSGRVNSIAVDPRGNDVAYLGGADGGIWKTSDGGVSWIPLTDEQASLSTGAIAIDPAHPDTIYVGTGEENFNIDAYTGAGILKSTDAGVSWANIVGPFSHQRIAALAVHPTDGVTLLAASNLGLFRSTDAGQTWSSVLSGTAISVYFDPAKPGVAWAGIGNVDGQDANGVYRSTDAGQTWILASGASPNTLPTGSAAGRIEVVNVPTSPDTALAAVANPFKDGGSTLNGIYRTSDAGQHWTKLSAPDFCRPQCWYDLALRPHPSDPNLIFAAGVNLARTLNGGLSWQLQPSNGSLGSPHVDHHALVFTADGTRLYDGNDGGIWSADNPGAGSIPWKNLNATLALTQHYPGLSIHPTDATIALAGSQDNGTHLYQGNPRWTEVIGGDGGWTAIDPSSPNVAYAEYVNASLFRTLRLDFSDILDITHGIDPKDRTRFISAYVLDPSNPQRLYFGTQRLYRSQDGGGLWRPISPDLTHPPSPTATGQAYTISSIALAPYDSNVIYTAAGSGAVFASTDGSATWVDRSAGLPMRAATHLTADLIDPGTVYATFSGFPAASDPIQGHIFKSTNFGAAWSDISGNLPNLPVDDLAIDPDLPDTLYAGTDLGVMFTSDAGATWAPLGTGLPKTAVTSLVLHRATRTLRAATHGRSVWDYALGPGAGFAPVISSLTPTTKNAGDPDFTLAISGSNFGPGIHVRWNGQERRVISATSTMLAVEIPASDIQGVGRAAVIVFNPSRGAGASLPANFIIGPAPSIAAGGLAIAATSSGAGNASPGAILSLYGANLAGAVSQAVGYPLPETLGQVTLTVGGIPAPLYFVSANQINFQVPYETPLNRAQNVVLSQGSLASNAVALSMNRVSPGLFSANQQGTGQGAIRIANSAALADPSRPAQIGETIEIYCTGLGAVSPAGVTGDAAGSSPLSMTLLQPFVTIGGVNATVSFSGLAPGYAGLYQVNAQVPAGAAPDGAVPVVLTIGGVASNMVTMAVR